MSADNGFIIRKILKRGEPKFVLQMYFASEEDYPPIEKAHRANIFDSLLDAVMAFSRLDNETPSEYGLRIDIERIAE